MATPSLAMIPSGYKAGKVYSVLPESGVGDFDFTRGTTATRINSSGLIETVIGCKCNKWFFISRRRLECF